MNGQSLDITAEKVQQLKALFPEAFTEDKIDWEKLKATLGGYIYFNNERYLLNWAGKGDAFKTLQIPTSKTLIPVKEEGINFDDTQHIFIEGENLETLKVLQQSYNNKVKMIYIDPPYNTGNDSFVYPDKFSEDKADYDRRVGEVSENGNKNKEDILRKNSKENGHYHSNWLSMMMPRLFLAKYLLREDGVIFVSIDDNEVHNLRLLMNEVFGEDNFVAQIIVKSNPGGRDYGGIALTHEYILVFSKSQNELNLFDNKNKGFAYRDEIGAFDTRELRNRNIKFNSDNRANLCYPFYVNPANKDENDLFEVSLTKKDGFIEVMPLKSQGIQTVWRWGKDKVLNNLNINVKAKLKNNKTFMIVEKYRSSLERLRSIFDETDVRNEFGSLVIKELFGGKPFDYPKSTALIRKVLLLGSGSNDLILDFFAGSGTTAQAVMELNKEDGGNRKYICVQLAEECDIENETYKAGYEAGYKTIAEISKERIRRASRKVQEEITAEIAAANLRITALEAELNVEEVQEEIERLENRIAELQPQDLGFKVLKLHDSNFEQWRQLKEYTAENLSKQIQLSIDNIMPTSTVQGMVYELLLKNGLDLNSRIDKQGEIYNINEGELVLLLTEVTEAVIDKVIALAPQKVIALDKIFEGDDQLKTNTVLQMNDEGIKFRTI